MDDIADLIAKRADLTPGRVAMEEWPSGRRVTYGNLDARAAAAAGLLKALGAGPGERVAVLCRNRIAFFELLFACGKLGAILVPLNWRMPAPEIAGLLDLAHPAALFYGTEDADAASAFRDRAMPLVGLDDPGPDGYEARLAAASPPPGRTHWPGDETWYLLFTSGTTGRPKAVIQTYRMALVNYINIRQAIDLRADDVTLNFLPLFHTAGINLHALPTLIAGGRVLVLPGFEPDLIVPLIADGGLDTFFGVPAVYRELSLHPRFSSLDLSHVRHWGCGGAPLPDSFVRLYAERGALVCNGFGMTETGPTAFLMDQTHAADKIGSVGKAQLLVSARIVKPDGTNATTDETGEIWLRGPGITPGYWRDEEATRQAFADGGWLKSGDLACRDAEGYYSIVGRLKEMYISGAENVYPAEVENVLAEHPAVLEAAVVGVADEVWGEVGRAYILLRPETAADAAGLAGFCRERLAPYKVPQSFVFVQDFPRTAAGKVQKHLLQEPRVEA